MVRYKNDSKAGTNGTKGSDTGDKPITIGDKNGNKK